MLPCLCRGSAPIADMIFDIDLGKLVPEEAVESIGFPTLVIHGDADTRIPTDHGRRVYEAAYPGSEMWVVPYFKDRLGGE